MTTASRDFRNGDLLKLLRVDQHELRALLNLEPFASRQRIKRSPTLFTALDALCLLVLSRLHQFGLAPKALQGISEAVHEALQRPVAATRLDELRFHQSEDGQIAFGAATSELQTIEMVVPLTAIRLQLLQYTGAGQITGQTEMALLGRLSHNAPSSPAVARRSRS